MTTTSPQPLSTSGSFNESGVQFVWDSTSLKYAFKCPRYYQYKMIENYRPRGNSVHLWFGGHYATALETYHKLRAEGSSFDEALESIIRTTLIATWDSEKNTPDTFLDPKKTRQSLIRTIVWYLDEFRDDKFSTVTLDSGKAAVELTFKLPVDNGVLFSGHFDRFCEDENGDQYVHDQKTTGQTLSPYYWKQFSPDVQFSMYSFVGKAAFHLPIKGVIIDAAQVAVGFTRFGRVEALRSAAILDEWYDDCMDVIEKTQAYTKANRFPKNTESCNNFGGCEFRSICAREPSLRKNFLEAEFHTSEPRWDPSVDR